MGRKENVLHHLGNPNFEIIRLDLVHPLLLEVDQIYHLACPGLPACLGEMPTSSFNLYARGINRAKGGTDDDSCYLCNALIHYIFSGLAKFVDKSVHMFDQRNLTSGGVGAPVHKLDGHKWFLDKASIFRRAAEDDFLNIWDYEGICLSILKFTNLKYSRVEIDEVRLEWAECMLDYI
ncbi:hypothetical protein ZIOFF_062718 [Zingiber officinale]|uniref:Uncharacterized protein n=1 Tax=Zingiber officinale TaxID=94328 RepID=A0A8J5F1G8_ZINOF|nr:hypothetical protein ZIOFF_062718 [Zingiber officinale]